LLDNVAIEGEKALNFNVHQKNYEQRPVYKDVFVCIERLSMPHQPSMLLRSVSTSKREIQCLNERREVEVFDLGIFVQPPLNNKFILQKKLQPNG